ncbi:MerR family transcriptional regulator [Caenimonas koreensis DSM 17982]|uniref:MerR family transcriptional regulator n=1 Tax=Caenimonas koreensis DSM 17982 TaxID=1121255 RepID=A0A844AVL7_9BURK|nr:MerR family transcriptional regulator [Caenimonas koreensis]MRD46428.1 MerR family transcriptional regulator [Caenimonas koreensis DSM 17982]
MQHLKVGELARSSGLTVRTLHHYDDIGLLKPSGRSDSGYRLYSEQDVARLHGIQALRHLGLPLSDIAQLLDGDAAAPQTILTQQINALERQIEQANELRGRLALIRDDITSGTPPVMGDWLGALSLMATYGKYFSAQELKKIFQDWQKIEVQWPALIEEVRHEMKRGTAPDSPVAQTLARRWMALVHHWMGGDFELMHRWGEMYKNEPSAHGRKGGPPTEVFEFMQKAADVRLAFLKRHYTMEELGKIRYVPEEAWRDVQARAQALMQQGKPATGRAARALAAHWSGLVDQLVSGDADMRRKLFELQRDEPLARAASPISPEVRAYLLEALKIS